MNHTHAFPADSAILPRPHRRRCRSALATAIVAGFAFTAVASAQTSQPAAPGAPTLAATTAPTTATTRASTRNGNGATHGITTQPGGGLLLNFENASIDSVLDELS